MNAPVLSELPGWLLAWSDEFDGPRRRRWIRHLTAGGRRARLGNEELQCYTDSTENARLDGAGNLAIVGSGDRTRSWVSVASAVAATPLPG